jgi:hypothetical protein
MSDDEVLEGIAAEDLHAAINELGPADGTVAKGDKIIARTLDIALQRRGEEASGRPFPFLGKTIVRRN